MFKKMMALLATVSLVAMAACNSTVTAPVTEENDQASTRGGSRGNQELAPAKHCLDNERAIEIIAPASDQVLFAGASTYVAWLAIEPCGDFTATAEVSYDGGQSFQEIASGENIYSARWDNVGAEGAMAKVRVRLQDRLGELADEVELEFPLRPDNAPDDDRRGGAHERD